MDIPTIACAGHNLFLFYPDGHTEIRDMRSPEKRDYDDAYNALDQEYPGLRE